MPSERKLQAKKDNGPRAVALLQLDSKGKSSLIPIAILIDGHFWDASSYKADPVPMALDPGTVYEVERTGSSLGLFTVGGALHSNAVNSPTPWLATGSYKEGGAEVATSEHKAESAPAGIDNVDAPPRLTHDPTKAAPPATTAPSTSSTPPPSNPPSSGPRSDDEPPRLTKPKSSAPEQPSSPPPTSTQPTDASKPASGKPSDSPDKGSTIPVSDSGASEANRPVLRHGKPAESFADEDIPGYSKPGAEPKSAAAAKAAPAPPASDVQLIPAISDAGGPRPQSYSYEWIKGDEDDRRKQMMDLARQQLHAYLAAQSKARIAPVPTHSQPARHVPSAAEPIFENVHMIAFDLWKSNQPVIVFSATAHLPTPPPNSGYPEGYSALQYSILLVAYPDIYGNLRKLYSGVTDKFHLDLTPRLDLIDALDANGDGRGDLLFRETTDQGTGWLIYGVGADKLWKIFDSLSLE